MRKLLTVVLLLLCSFHSMAQEKSVSGKITDEKDGTPLSGVSIIVKGTSVGTTTSSDGTFKTRSDFKGKHVYIHFMDPLGQKSAIEIDPLVKLYQTYKDDIRFITVYPSREDEKSKEVLAKIPWEKFAIDENASILKAYKVETFPYYVLLDEIGHVVAAPALTPMPSGQYETIDRTFFYIQNALKELKEYRR